MTVVRGTEVRSGVPIRITNVSKTFGEDDEQPFLALNNRVETSLLFDHFFRYSFHQSISC